MIQNYFCSQNLEVWSCIMTATWNRCRCWRRSRKSDRRWGRRLSGSASCHAPARAWPVVVVSIWTYRRSISKEKVRWIFYILVVAFSSSHWILNFLYFPGCMKFTYDPYEFSIGMNMLFDNSTVYENSVSGTNQT